MTVELTKDQLTFLEECNLEFSERFTDADLEYKKIYDLGIPPQPIVYPWWSHAGRGRNANRDRPGNSRYNDNYRDRSRDCHQEGRSVSESPLAHSWYGSHRDGNNFYRHQAGGGRYTNNYRDGHTGAHSRYESHRDGSNVDRNQAGGSQGSNNYNDRHSGDHQEDKYRHKDYNQQRYRPY